MNSPKSKDRSHNDPCLFNGVLSFFLMTASYWPYVQTGVLIITEHIATAHIYAPSVVATGGETSR